MKKKPTLSVLRRELERQEKIENKASRDAEALRDQIAHESTTLRRGDRVRFQYNGKSYTGTVKQVNYWKGSSWSMRECRMVQHTKKSFFSLAVLPDKRVNCVRVYPRGMTHASRFLI